MSLSFYLDQIQRPSWQSETNPAPSPSARYFGGPAKTMSQADWNKLFLGFGAMVIGQFMAILDIQIVAASLPQGRTGLKCG